MSRWIMMSAYLDFCFAHLYENDIPLFKLDPLFGKRGFIMFLDFFLGAIKYALVSYAWLRG